MCEDSLLEQIEQVRHEMYHLSKTAKLNSQVMIDRSQQLDDLLNLYQTKYVTHSYINKQQ